MITKTMLKLAMIGTLQLHGKQIYKEVFGFSPRVNYETDDSKYVAMYRSGQFPKIKFVFNLAETNDFWDIEYKIYRNDQAFMHFTQVKVPFNFKAMDYTEDMLYVSLRDAFWHIKERIDESRAEAA